ncbi:MAG TPA: tetratricopeptide repeat protein [Candidatus Acidoferrum sp.]|nr:tetratricopeptide repeat protein [Candidatus Acidoferrum sp.]
MRAQTDYDKVALAPLPHLGDIGNCVQSQAAVLPVSAPEETSLFYFRRGYCTLAGATITGNREEYATAAADFDRAIEAWPARIRRPSKKQVPEPVSSGLRILPWVARLHTSLDAAAQQQAQQQIAAAVEESSCTSNLMPATQCQQIVSTGHEWLGWMALGRRDLATAAQQFVATHDTGWPEWVDGQRQFEQGNYAEAVRQERRAITAWKAMWQDGGPTLVRRLGPAPNIPIAQADLGGAQLLAGDGRGAIATLDASLKAKPGNPAALYRRARAHDAAGEADAALADYGMASRVAFADTKELASGEAHLYRGIMLFRRKDFARAEDEFSSALNFEIPETLRADAQAWRHMAAVAGGSCVSEKELLTRGLASVSPYFPKQEARQVASVCGVSSKAGVQ